MSMEIHGYGHELARVFWIAVNSPDINHDLAEKQNISLLDEHVCGCRDSESREMSRRVKNNEGGHKGLQGFGDFKFAISASNENKVRYKNTTRRVYKHAFFKTAYLGYSPLLFFPSRSWQTLQA
jgi:hypothetical protein